MAFITHGRINQEPLTEAAKMATNQIYQYSVISALMTGLASSASSTTVSNLLSHGDTGLGTFENMDGEMVVVDGKAYQLKADGSVRAVHAETKVPFATVTRFEPQITKQSSFEDKDHLLRRITEMLPRARNHIVAIHMQGHFKMVQCRTVPPQAYEGEPLTELGKRQIVKVYEDVAGTIVGFRSPQWSQGVSVAGIHIHFINHSREIGGHILAVRADEEVDLAVSLCRDLHIELPTSEEFGARDLEHDEEGLKKVEG